MGVGRGVTLVVFEKAGRFSRTGRCNRRWNPADVFVQRAVRGVCGTGVSDGGGVEGGVRSREHGTRGGTKADEATAIQHFHMARCSNGFPLSVHELEILCEEGRVNHAIGAVELMHQEGFQVSQDILYHLLQGCIHSRDLPACRRMSSLIVRTGFESNTLLVSHLIRILALCGGLLDANEVFSKLAAPGLFTWAAVIAANAKYGKADEAISLYHRMLRSGVKPNEHVFVAVLKACANSEALAQGKLIHKEIEQSGFQCNGFVGNTLIDMYSKCGRTEDARRVFDNLSSRDLVSWNAMIAGYAQDGRVQSTFQLLEKMQQEGTHPDKVTFMTILKACCCSDALLEGRLIHSCLAKYGLDSDTGIASTLIDMYSKCGSILDAIQVFDHLATRDLVSWSAMIAAYAKHERSDEAIQLFRRMQLESLPPNKVTLLSVLKACTSLAALDQGKLVHACIVELDCEADTKVCNTLINMYARCGSLQDAQSVFDRLPGRDLVSWNAIIAGHSQNGLHHKAIHLFQQMQQEGLQPDEVTLTGILKACSSIPALDQGRVIHTKAMQIGLVSNVMVGNSLIDMYTKCGSVEDARLVFDSLPSKDMVSWTAIIGAYAHYGDGVQALQLFDMMQQHGMSPNKVTYLSILKACSSTSDLAVGRLCHDRIIQSGFESDVFVGNTLLDMYVKTGSLVDARKVFDRLPVKDRISWNAMICGYAQHQHSEEALEIFRHMCSERMPPNEFTFVSVLQACSQVARLDQGKLIHGQIMEGGFDSDVFVCSTLIDMYAKCGSFANARRVFEKLPTRNLVSWNAVIAGCADCGNSEEALELWKRMEWEGVHADEVTLISILKACSRMTALDQGKLIHSRVIENGWESILVVGNALIDLYAKCGSVDAAREVFDHLQVKDLVSWTALIKGYARHGRGQEALQLSEKMQQVGMQPDDVTFVSMLKACSSIAALQQGKQIHAQVVECGYLSDVFVASSLIDMYAKCGSLVDAHAVFNRLPSRNLVAWNTIIAGYSQHGYGLEALQLFQRMLREGMEPNDVTFVSLLSACSHAGLLEEGQQIFQSMFERFNILPATKHYACMVDLLGRAGHLREADSLVDTMPSTPDIVVWMSLLGACRIHGNWDLGRHAFESILKLDPTNAAAYVLMSNIYSAAGMWEDAEQVDCMMHNAGARRDLGLTWMEADNHVHTFVVEDKEHPDRIQIYATLKIMLGTIQQEVQGLGSHRARSC